MNGGFYPIVTSAAIAIALTAAGSLVVWFLWWAWWRLPKQEVERLQPMIFDPAARSGAEDNIRKTVGQVIGGSAVLIGAVIGATLTYLQFSQQLQASRELLISNQVSKGFEQLASKDAVMQLGGIYALEGVMKNSEQYHEPVVEALCAFVRDRTANETGDGPPVTEIQAALTVIGRRTPIETRPLDLHNAHIPRADLREAQLGGAYLFYADLRYSDLRSSDLSGAILYYRNTQIAADLQSADLTGADLRGATVAQVQLDQACGTNVRLDPSLTIKPCR
jgi:hypothetical protein